MQVSRAADGDSGQRALGTVCKPSKSKVAELGGRVREQRAPSLVSIEMERRKQEEVSLSVVKEDEVTQEAECQRKKYLLNKQESSDES